MNKHHEQADRQDPQDQGNQEPAVIESRYAVHLQDPVQNAEAVKVADNIE